MRRLTTLILFTIFITGVVSGQWMQMYGPRGTAKIMHLDETDAYALTDSARIAKWNSTSEEWEYMYSGVPGDVVIEGVHAEEAVVVAAGQSGGEEKGIFRSRDGGNSWIEVPGLPEINFYSVHVVSDVWFASGIDFSGPPLFYSTNQGANFQACSGLDAASQTGPMIVFNGSIYVSTTDGIYYSSDSGVNFTKAGGNGLPQFEMLDHFFYSGNNLRAFYFSFSESKIFETSDNGENWTEIAMTGIEPDWILKSCDELNGEFYAIAAKDAASEFPKIYHSTDNGESWTAIGNDTPYPMLQSEEGFAINSEMMLAATTSGIFKSTDNGDTWEDASTGLRYNGFIQAQAFVQGNWIVSTAIGLGKSTVYPSEWEEMTSPNPGRTISQLHTAGTNLFAYDYSNLYRTSDLDSWENISPNFPDGFSLGNILGVEDKLYITGSNSGNHQMLISDDFGDTWTVKNVGSDYIAMIRGNSDKLVIAAGSALHESTDEGDTWTDYQNNGLPSSPNFFDYIPVGDRVVAWAGDFSESKMYYTDDLGENWIESQEAEAVGQVEQFLYVDESIVAASKFGFYISYNDGETWNHFHEGYGQRNANALLASGKYLLAGTRTDAAWFRPQSQLTSLKEITGNEIPEDFVLKQNYPNPFNPATKISFSTAKPGNVKLSIYNITGEKVATLIEQHLEAGNYEAEFNAGLLSSGVYLYKLETGNFVKVRKMMLLK